MANIDLSTQETRLGSRAMPIDLTTPIPGFREPMQIMSEEEDLDYRMVLARLNSKRKLFPREMMPLFYDVAVGDDEDEDSPLFHPAWPGFAYLLAFDRSLWLEKGTIYREYPELSEVSADDDYNPRWHHFLETQCARESYSGPFGFMLRFLECLVCSAVGPKTLVGGDGDCWSKFSSWCLEDRDPDQKIEFQALKENYRNYNLIWITELATGEFEFFEDEGIPMQIVEDAAEALERQWDVEYVKFGFTPEGDLHIEDCVAPDYWWFQLVENNIVAKPEGYVTINEFFRLFDDKEVLVGSSAIDAAEESKRVNAVEIMKTFASQELSDEYKATPSVPHSLSPNQRQALSKYLGHPIRSTHKKHSTNGHLFLECARHIARESLHNRFPHNTDVTTALHVGATVHEVRMWFEHEAHDFYFHIGEDKDVPRLYEDLAKLLGSKFANLNIPALTSIKGNVTSWHAGTLEAVFNMVAKDGRRRFYFKKEDIKRKYDVLYFEDCLYDMEDDFQDWWDKTGAKVGYSIMFCPDKLVDPSAVESNIYNYEERLVELDAAEQLVDRIWPSILLLLPAVPKLGELKEWLNKLLVEILKRGPDHFKKIVLDPLKKPGIVLHFLGMAFETVKWFPILQQIWNNYHEFIVENLLTVCISWKAGDGNGYSHKKRTWRNHIANRRFERKSGLYVDSEVVSIEGEMWTFKYHTSLGKSPITYSVNLPKHKRTVRVRDLIESYNPTTGEFTGDKWINVPADDWYGLYNWAAGEPVESINFQVMTTVLNRIRGGLALGSNVLVAPMDMISEDVRKIALAATMAFFQGSEIISEIENNPELKKAYSTNLEIFTAQLAKAGIVVLTGGIAIAAWFAYKWLMDRNPGIVIFQDALPNKIVRIPGNKSVKKESVAKLLDDTHWCFRHKELEAKKTCYMCELQRRGMFSATGVPSEGQEFHCLNAGVDNQLEIGFTGGEMVEALNLIRNAKNDHQQMGAIGVVPQIRNLEHFLESNIGGKQHVCAVEHISGGPGTGKSVVIRVLAKYFEELSETVAIGLPFRELLEDYQQAEVLGRPGKHDFNANTTWYTCKDKVATVLIIDEVTGMDWRVIRVFAMYLGVKKIILVGDAKQTRLAPENNEGVDATNERSGLDWTRVPIHELVWNYRNPAWVVKWLNWKFDYKMRSRDIRKLPPRLITREDYQDIKTEVERELVFSHDSAGPVFGRTSASGGGEGTVNLSVRSCQGKTYRGKVAVSSSIMDRATSQVHGMMCVAFSRSKSETLIVCPESTTDTVPTWMAEQLRIRNDEDINFIWSQPWPEPPSEVGQRDLTREEHRVNAALVNDHKQRRSIEVLKPVEEEHIVDNTHAGLDFERKETILDMEPTIPVVQDFPLWDVYRGVFQMCFFDAILEAFPMLKSNVYQLLEFTYFNDRAMGRNATDAWLDYLGIKTNDVLFDSHNDTKAFCSDFLMLWADEMLFGVGVVQQRKGGTKLVRANKRFLDQGSNSNNCVLLMLEKNHITRIESPKVWVSVQAHQEPVKLQLYGKYSNRFVFKCEKRTGTMLYNLTEPVYDLAEAPQLNETWIEDTALGGAVQVWGLPPTLSRVRETTLSRDHRNVSTRRTAFTSSWKSKINFELDIPKPQMKTKERFGTDGYKLATIVDPSDSFLNFPTLNPHSGVKGHPGENNVKISPEGFIFSKTKAGKLRRHPKTIYRSFTRGMVQHFGPSPVETLVSSQRLGKREKKPVVDQETSKWMSDRAKEYFRENFRHARLSAEEANWVLQKAYRDSEARNYHGRADAQRKKNPFEPYIITVAQKSTEKYKFPLNPFKNGQALSMTPPRFNQEFVPFMRLVNATNKISAGPDLFFDDFESEEGFSKKLSLAIKGVGENPRFGIGDARNFDSQQSRLTVEFGEKVFVEELMGTKLHLDDYYKIREKMPFIAHGLFKGTTNYEKGSGFPDTKFGNQTLQGMLCNYRYEGVGRKVVATKGDDYLRVQYGLKINEAKDREIRKVTQMEITGEVGDGGSYIGYSVSRSGCLPNVVHRTYKALAAKARDYEHFSQQQISYRETVQRIRECGLEQTLTVGAEACGYSKELAAACYTVLNSLGHVSKAQWLKATKPRISLDYHLNKADGPTLI